jgi:hypothetical protein
MAEAEALAVLAASVAPLAAMAGIVDVAVMEALE